MIALELEREAISKISPVKLEKYLEDKGWTKTKVIGDIAAVWSYQKTDKTVGVLVPLDRDFADFDNRMMEVFIILEKVENRPRSAILATLQNTSIIAKAQHREILEFRFSYVYENNQEAPAKKIGSVLKSLQDFLGAIGKSKIQSKRLSVRQEMKSELELSIVETFTGSFGLRLGLSQGQPRQLNLLEDPIAEQAAQDLLELISASTHEDSDILQEKISALYGKSSIKFKSFLTHLSTLQANLSLDWGSVDPGKGGFAEISYTNILRALEIINKKEVENPRRIYLIGKLMLAGVGNNKKYRKFIFEEQESHHDYQGTISKELLKNIGNDLNVGKKLYRATLEETTSVNTATGEEETNYLLVELENLSMDN
ncbi:MAG: hypothetical protein F6K47_39910 [Symploca sp. SIO2E6]|nr:hypothetical protein [Symploca sp. SIO2E6]